MAEFARPWQGSFGVGTQGAAIGTLVAATKWQAIDSESLKEDRGGRQAIKAIRRNQDLVLALKGKRQVSGSVSGPLIPDDAFTGLILAQIFGNNNTVTGAGTTGYRIRKHYSIWCNKRPIPANYQCQNRFKRKANSSIIKR